MCYLDRFSNFIFLSLPSSVLTMHFSSSIMLSIVPLAGFYMSEETGQREDLRWKLMREIVGNLCVHSDFSSGYACFMHIFKDRVLTKNPIRLLPEIPEGELTIQQLSNYTKNPLLVRVFHELHWAEDMGSGTRNILRYAPIYYPNYKIEINSGQQFIFSITYSDNVQGCPRAYR